MRERKELPHYWICFDCAEIRNGKWPKGHIATCALMICPYCNEEAALAPIVDFDWKDFDFKIYRD